MREQICLFLVAILFWVSCPAAETTGGNAQENRECAEPFHPNDPTYVGPEPWCKDGARQYTLFNDTSAGHINAPGAWCRVYEPDHVNGFRVSPGLSQKEVVIACIDDGVMLDFSSLADLGVRFQDASRCADCAIGGYAAHPDLAPNQWFNTGEIEGDVDANGDLVPDDEDDDGNGKIDDYFGWNFVETGREKWPYPTMPDMEGRPESHGTDAMGIAAARGNDGVSIAAMGVDYGIAGVCWDAKIMPVKYSYMVHSTHLGGDTVGDRHMAEAIRYAANTGADVLSLCAVTRGYDPEHQDAIRYARSKGCVVVVPAANGNYNIDTVDCYGTTYPAVLPEVLCVGAVDQENRRCNPRDWGRDKMDNLSMGSNYGWVLDVVAPSLADVTRYTGMSGNGDDLPAPNQNESPFNGKFGDSGPWCTSFKSDPDELGENAKFPCGPTYGHRSGTSSAFPQISGLAVLLLTVDEHLSPADIQSIMQWSAQDLCYTDTMYFRGQDFKDLLLEPGCALFERRDPQSPLTHVFSITYSAYPGRDEQTGWGIVDAAAAVDWAQRSRFAVTGRNGKNVLSVDSEGNCALDGRVVPSVSDDQLKRVLDGSSDAEIFAKDASGNPLVVLDKEWKTSTTPIGDDFWPTLYLKGSVWQKKTLDPPPRSFIVNGPTGAPVAYVSSAESTFDDPAHTEMLAIPAGSLVVQGAVFMASDPDPQAHNTCLALWDRFEPGKSGEVQNSATWSSASLFSESPQWQLSSEAWSIGQEDGETYLRSRTDERNGQEDRSCGIPLKHPVGRWGGEEPVSLEINIDIKPVIESSDDGYRDSESLPLPLEIALCSGAPSDQEYVGLRLEHGPEENKFLLKGAGTGREIKMADVKFVQQPAYVVPPEPLGSLAPGTWYELHIQRAYDPATHKGTFRVWIRYRDRIHDGVIRHDSSERAIAPQGGYKWAQVFDETLGAPVAPHPSTSLVLSTGSENGSGQGYWCFDNLIVTTLLPGSGFPLDTPLGDLPYRVWNGN